MCNIEMFCIVVALSSSLAHSVHSSYQCLLLSLHPMYTLFTPPTSVCCSLLIPCTLCSLLLPVSAALSTSHAHSVHSSYQCLLLSLHPMYTLFTPPTSVCCSLRIPCTLCSLLLPCLLLSPHPLYTLFTPPTMSVALSSSHAHSVHSSYQCLLLSPHPLHTLFTPPTSVCCSLHIPCTLCSLLLPCLLLSPHPLHTLFTPPTMSAALSSSLAHSI